MLRKKSRGYKSFIPVEYFFAVASSFTFSQDSCILSTEAGVIVNNYRALRSLSQGQTKLLLKGTLLSTLENPVVQPATFSSFSSSEKQTTNTKDGATPSTSSSTPSPKTPNCSEDADTAPSPRSPNAAQPYSNTIDAPVSPSNSSGNQVDEDLMHTSSDVDSTDLTNKEVSGKLFVERHFINNFFKVLSSSRNSPPDESHSRAKQVDQKCTRSHQGLENF